MMRPHHCQVSNQLCLVISILLWILAPRGLAIYPSYPKLYLDRFAAAVANGSATLAWRQPLSGLSQWGLSLNAYKIEDASYLNFTSSLIPVGTTNAQLIVQAVPNNSSWVQFFVIVLTANTPNSQLINYNFNWIPVTTPNACYTQYASSSKFPLAGLSSPTVRVYISSVLLLAGSISRFGVDYTYSFASSTVTITLCTSAGAELKSVGFTILLLNTETLEPQISSYSYTSRFNSSGLTFARNLNVPFSPFGYPYSNFMCILGVVSMQYNSSINEATFQPNISSSNIEGLLTTSNTQVLNYAADCFSQCLNRTALINGSTNICSYCYNYLSGCLTCKTISNCSTCDSSYFLRDNFTCQSCSVSIPYCGGCPNASICTACYSGRFLYAGNTSCPLCSQFIPNCYTCTNTSVCTSCASSRFFFYAGNTSCLICRDYIPYCYSCASMSVCYSCESAYYFVSASSSACLLCGSQMPACVTCRNMSYCYGCQNNTFFLQGNRSECLLCSNYIISCSTCTSAIDCLTCMNATTYLNSNRSLCLPCNTTVRHCVQCLSETVCTICKQPTILAQGNQCKFCHQLMSYCSECNSATYCTTCQRQTFLSSSRTSCYLCRSYMQLCLQCSSITSCSSCSIGWPVTGGCTSSPGCTQVVQTSDLGTLLATCVQCDSSEFKLDQYTRKCVCKEGKIVGFHCTSVIGCISTLKIAGVVQCTYCNGQHHFLFDNATKSCYCSQGYEVNSQTCVQICGDGKVLNSQCDDGNRVDGDGCSSNCTVQAGYRCITASKSTPSLCRQISYNLDVRIAGTLRVDTLNQAIFTFSFSPQQPYLAMMDLHQFFNFQVAQALVDSVDWKYSNSELTATVSFSSDLEGKTAVANFTFDRFYIPHDPIVLSFEIKSDGMQLIYYSNQAGFELLNSIFVGLSVGCLIILVVGSWSHKMVAVQLIQTFQTIYYLHFALNNYTIPVRSIQMLSLVGINNLYWQQSSQNLVMFAAYERIQHSKVYSEYSLMILVAPAGIYLCLLLAQYLVGEFCSQKAQMLFRRAQIKIYRCFVFPATLGFIFPYFLVSATLSTRSTDSESVLPSATVSLVRLLELLSSALVLTNQFKYILIPFRREEDEQFRFTLANRLYVPIYQLYSLGMTALLWLWIRTGTTLCLFLIAGLLILMIGYQIISRPYFKMIDNISVCFNYLIIVGFLAFFYLRNEGIISSDEHLDTISCYSIAGVLCFSVALSTIRVLREFLCSGSSAQVASSSKKDQKALLINRQQTSLKQMIKMLSQASKPQRQALLERRTKPKRLVYGKEKKEDSEIAKKIETMREHLGRIRKNNQERAVREQVEDV